MALSPFPGEKGAVNLAARSHYRRLKEALTCKPRGKSCTWRQTWQLRTSYRQIGTCFFGCLAEYLKSEQAPLKFIANVLDVSLEDANSLYRELIG